MSCIVQRFAAQAGPQGLLPLRRCVDSEPSLHLPMNYPARNLPNGRAVVHPSREPLQPKHATACRQTLRAVRAGSYGARRGRAALLLQQRSGASLRSLVF